MQTPQSAIRLWTVFPPLVWSSLNRLSCGIGLETNQRWLQHLRDGIWSKQANCQYLRRWNQDYGPQIERNNWTSKNWTHICIFDSGYWTNKLLFRSQKRTKSASKNHQIVPTCIHQQSPSQIPFRQSLFGQHAIKKTTSLKHKTDG